MSKIRVDLESVQVTEGEGIGEGDFELRIQVQEGTNHMVWPSHVSPTIIAIPASKGRGQTLVCLP